MVVKITPGKDLTLARLGSSINNPSEGPGAEGGGWDSNVHQSGGNAPFPLRKLHVQILWIINATVPSAASKDPLFNSTSYTRGVTAARSVVPGGE